MEKINKIPTDEELIELSNSINEILKLVKHDNLTVTFEYPKELIKQIDEYLFLKEHDSLEGHVYPNDVELLINNVKFLFKEKVDEKDELLQTDNNVTK